MECLLDILVQNMHGIIHRFCFDCCCKFVFFAATDFHNGISFRAHSSYGWMENIINLGLIIVGPGLIASVPFWQISGFFRFFPLVPPPRNIENKSCLNDIKFWEVSGNSKTSRFWKLQLSHGWSDTWFYYRPINAHF